MEKGIYILGNDVVFDQLIALIHSIEQNIGKDLPICVVPYDENTARSRSATQRYPQVQWFDDAELLTKWETFSTRIWEAHPTAFEVWEQRGVNGVNRLGMHRRFCCFDGPFEKFIYLDADILALNSFDCLFESLDEHDFVTYDFQYKDLSHVFDETAPKLTEVFSSDRLSSEIFCAGLYASKKGVFTDAMLNSLLTQLQAGDADILYYNGPDQSILNYMVMKSGISAMNLARTLPTTQRTGCCVTSPHFSQRTVNGNPVLFDQQTQLIYLHYIGVGSRFFHQVCTGENILFPYRDLFLYYRYLNENEQPQLVGKPVHYKTPILKPHQKIARKVRQFVTAFRQPKTPLPLPSSSAKSKRLPG